MFCFKNYLEQTNRKDWKFISESQLWLIISHLKQFLRDTFIWKKTPLVSDVDCWCWSQRYWLLSVPTNTVQTGETSFIHQPAETAFFLLLPRTKMRCWVTIGKRIFDVFSIMFKCSLSPQTQRVPSFGGKLNTKSESLTHFSFSNLYIWFICAFHNIDMCYITHYIIIITIPSVVLRTVSCLPGLDWPPRSVEERVRVSLSVRDVPATDPDRPHHSEVPDLTPHLTLQEVLQFLGRSVLPLSDQSHQSPGGHHSQAGPVRALSSAQLWSSLQEQQDRSFNETPKENICHKNLRRSRIFPGFPQNWDPPDGGRLSVWQLSAGGDPGGSDWPAVWPPWVWPQDGIYRTK